MNKQRIAEIETRLDEVRDALSRVEALYDERHALVQELNHLNIEGTGLKIGMKLLMNEALFIDRAQYIIRASDTQAGTVAEIAYYLPSDNTIRIRWHDGGLSIGDVPLNIIRSMRADYLAAHPELIGGHE